MGILSIILYYNFFNLLVLLALKKISSQRNLIEEIKKGKRSKFHYLDYLLMNYNIQKTSCKIFLLFEILGDIVFTSSLILLQEYPIVQILILFFIFLTKPTTILFFAPIKMSNYYYNTMISSFGYSTILLLFMIHHLFEDSLSPKQSTIYIGYPVLSIIFTMMVLSKGQIIYSSLSLCFKSVYQYLSGSKSAKKDKNMDDKKINNVIEANPRLIKSKNPLSIQKI